MLKDNAVGVIIFKKFGDKNESEIKYLLLKAHKWGTFPKGHIDAGEAKLDAALRELFEETGIKSDEIKLISEDILLTQQYHFKDNKKGLIQKTNEFYFAEVQNDKVTIDNDEISEYRWCTMNEALKLSEYKNFEEVIIKADEIVKKFLNKK
ncbi:MAG TPA: NUDIX domain-containing protein [Ignavibacteria bacterium]|nr:NUDIX domain-containing protein [Ignavibacteria bacterium]